MHNQHLCYWWSFNRHKVQYTNSSQIASPPSLHLTPFNLYFPNPLDIQVLWNVLHFRLLHFRLGGPNRKCYNRKCNNSLPMFDYLLVRFSFPILCCYEIFEYNFPLEMNDQYWCCFMELQENKNSIYQQLPSNRFAISMPYPFQFILSQPFCYTGFEVCITISVITFSVGWLQPEM